MNGLVECRICILMIVRYGRKGDDRIDMGDEMMKKKH